MGWTCQGSAAMGLIEGERTPWRCFSFPGLADVALCLEEHVEDVQGGPGQRGASSGAVQGHPPPSPGEEDGAHLVEEPVRRRAG